MLIDRIYFVNQYFFKYFFPFIIVVVMTSKERTHNLHTALNDALDVLSTLQDDDSTESSILKFASFQHMSNAFHEYQNTRNQCCEDVRLPLEPLNTNNDYLVVWLHCDDIEEDTIKNLQYVFNHIEIFNSMQKCIDFLRQLDSTTVRLFLITSCFYNGMVFSCFDFFKKIVLCTF